MAASPSSREIAAIALPALGALAAEPLYLLADTAIVGHLGTVPLAALALAASVLGALVSLCNFLAYGTTAHVARLAGSGDHERAAAIGVASLWLALLVGIALALACVVFAGPLMELLAGEHGQVSAAAARYLRLSAPGLPCALIALAAQGYLRGEARMRLPLIVVGASAALNVVLELVLVYGLGWGLDGSALGTVGAQLVMAAWFVVVVVREHGLVPPDRMMLRSLTALGWPIVVRSGALLLSFVIAGAVLARIGTGALGAHQIAFQLFIFLALVLDALAIAAQVLVGRALGARDGDAAYGVALAMCRWSLVAGIVCGLLLLAGGGVIPRAFTSDRAVLEQARELWPLFALMLPVGAVVFALDGVLLGAGDTRYLALAMVVAALCVFVPIALLALHFGWGVSGVWWGLVALMAARLAALWPRLVGRSWLRLGTL